MKTHKTLHIWLPKEWIYNICVMPCYKEICAQWGTITKPTNSLHKFLLLHCGWTSSFGGLRFNPNLTDLIK